jgi:hypothetical protein
MAKTKHVIVKWREGGWTFSHHVPWQKAFTFSKKKSDQRMEQPDYIFPKPEHASPFIEAHKIVEAENLQEVESICRTLN